jgi:hypothetical protein
MLRVAGMWLRLTSASSGRDLASLGAAAEAECWADKLSRDRT